MTAVGGRIDWKAIREAVERSRQALAIGGEPGPERRAEILHARAATLATRRTRREAREPQTSVLTFTLADERYALPLTALIAVLRSRPLGPVPGAAASVAGLLYERADIWMIHALRLLLGLPAAAADAPGFLLLLRATGFRVDATGEIRKVDLSRLTPVDPSSGRHPMVLGATGDAVAVLDAAALQDHPALKEVT